MSFGSSLSWYFLIRWVRLFSWEGQQWLSDAMFSFGYCLITVGRWSNINPVRPNCGCMTTGVERFRCQLEYGLLRETSIITCRVAKEMPPQQTHFFQIIRLHQPFLYCLFSVENSIVCVLHKCFLGSTIVSMNFTLRWKSLYSSIQYSYTLIQYFFMVY